MFDGGDYSATGFPDEVTNYFMNVENDDQNAEIIALIEEFHESFLLNNTYLPVNLYLSGTGENSADSIGLTFTSIITMSDGATFEVDTPIPALGDINSINSTENYFENLIMNSINSDLSNGVSGFIESLGTTGQVAWVFQSIGTDNYVSSVEIVANGNLIVVPSVNLSEGSSFWYMYSNAWQTFAITYLNNAAYQLSLIPDSDPLVFYAVLLALAEAGAMIELMVDHMGTAYQVYAQYTINLNSEPVNLELTGETVISEFPLTIWDYNALSSLDSSEEDYLETMGEHLDMQILGHYAFSDYLVILGKWNAAAYFNTSRYVIEGQAKDFVLKVSQRKSGKLANPEDLQDGDIFQLFFLGDLGFSDKTKLKVVGSEENEYIRRIYFTDGKIPLRTMNVGANPGIYAPYQNNPGFFDLFVEANLSIPMVTGFEEGGSLDSIAHSYSFRYKTKDGRLSRMSPVCNPASVPVTNKGTSAAFTKGGNADVK